MTSLLHELHRSAEAEFQPYGEIEIVSTFGEPQAEYAAIRKGCALMDWPQRGIIELTGKDRLTFLNNLITNQVYDKEKKVPLAAGQSIYAFFLNAKSGRIVCDVNVIERGESTLLEMDARMIPQILAELERYRFSEQVKFEDRRDSLHEIALFGPRAPKVVSSISEAIVWRDDITGSPGMFVIVPRERARGLWMDLAARGVADPAAPDPQRRERQESARPIGWAAFNATRIEAGRPMFGIDFDDSVLPAETGQLSRAVSFTKGCYPGQEIVARMHARGQVARQIAGIRMNDDALPIAGTKVLDDPGNEIGGVTSSTISPVLSNVAICLAILKRPHFNLGSVVNIPAEGAMRKGTVVELPFWKAS